MPKKLTKYTDEELDVELNARADVRANEMLETFVSGDFFRHPLSRVRVQLLFDPVADPDMTHQAHAESCDINNIIRTFDRTGSLPPAKKAPVFDDVSNLNRPLSELMNESKATFDAYFSAMSDRAKEERESRFAKPEVTPPVVSSPPAESPPSTGA